MRPDALTGPGVVAAGVLLVIAGFAAAGFAIWVGVRIRQDPVRYALPSMIAVIVGGLLVPPLLNAVIQAQGPPPPGVPRPTAVAIDPAEIVSWSLVAFVILLAWRQQR